MTEEMPMHHAMIRFREGADVYVLMGPTEPDGDLGVTMQGDANSMRHMHKIFTDILKLEEIL